TDLKLDVFFNPGQNEQRFSEIQLGDCGGGVVSQDSSFAKEGHLIGAAFTRSPEAMLQLSWGTPTDVWSFGNAASSCTGGGYHHFDPGWEGLEPEDQDYEMTVLKRMYRSFGPFPPSIVDVLDPGSFEIVHFLNQQGPPQRPLQRWSTEEIPSADNDFLRRISRLDPRDRPTVEEILVDEWFAEESDETREPTPQAANSSADEGVDS
ncbi:hypothetical protein LZ31DRAFT_605347, partial [Colletotrichum somersetense]